VTKAIEKAQVRVETQNYEIRKHLLEYDDVVNKQREVIYELRRAALEGHDLCGQFDDFVQSAVKGLIEGSTSADNAADYWDMTTLSRLYQGLVLAPMPLEPEEHLDMGYEVFIEKLVTFAQERFQAKVDGLGSDFTKQLQKYVLIQVLDENWRDHLNELILLRSGIGLRSYGQRDPLVEYKSESYQMFETLMDNIEKSSVSLFFRAELVAPPTQREPAVEKMSTQHQEVSAYNAGEAPAAMTNAPAPATKRPIQRDEPKVGRNDPCHCGSGLKYKKCCGKQG